MDFGSNSIFSYYIIKGSKELNSELKQIQIGDYSVSLSPKTIYELKEDKDISCLIIGLATCVTHDISAMDWLWDNCYDFNRVIEAEKHLGGKYVLFVRNKDSYYIIGDATCSLPIFYFKNVNGYIFSSNANQIAKMTGQVPEDSLVKIKKQGNGAMPYDYTIWKNIKRLIPNHYIDISSDAVLRFINEPQKTSKISAEEAACITIPYIKRIVKLYENRFSIICPLTSGKDSRLVLAALGLRKDLPLYTIKHIGFTDETADIVVPKIIAKGLGLNHVQVDDVSLSNENIEEADRVLGKNNYSKRALVIAHTVNHYFGGHAIINGDIIGQIGKCSLHRDISLAFATPSYFVCKMHNHAKDANKAMEEWMEDVQSSQEQVNIFDLFSIENRMGVWAANTYEIYNMIGQYNLNIINSRSVIYEWIKVSRAERKDSAIHIQTIKQLAPELLNFSFGKSGKIDKLVKYNGTTYLIASYFKHYVEGIKLRLKR